MFGDEYVTKTPEELNNMSASEIDITVNDRVVDKDRVFETADNGHAGTSAATPHHQIAQKLHNCNHRRYYHSPQVQETTSANNDSS